MTDQEWVAYSKYAWEITTRSPTLARKTARPGVVFHASTRKVSPGNTGAEKRTRSFLKQTTSFLHKAFSSSCPQNP
jgi:hypothetical protein